MALLPVLCVVSCNGHRSGENGDSAKADSASVVDTIKHADTTVKVDTIKPATDTSDMKTDTTNKTIHSKTEIKKTSVKKAKQQ